MPTLVFKTSCRPFGGTLQKWRSAEDLHLILITGTQRLANAAGSLVRLALHEVESIRGRIRTGT